MYSLHRPLKSEIFVDAYRLVTRRLHLLWCNATLKPGSSRWCLHIHPALVVAALFFIYYNCCLTLLPSDSFTVLFLRFMRSDLLWCQFTSSCSRPSIRSMGAVPSPACFQFLSSVFSHFTFVLNDHKMWKRPPCSNRKRW